MKASVLSILVLLSACAPSPLQRPTEISVNPILGDFTEFWSICGAAHAMTKDNLWLVSVSYPEASREVSVSADSAYVVRLIDFRGVRDLEAAVSLFQNNDIAYEDNDPIVVNAVSGQSQFNIRSRRPSWKSTVSIELQSVVFPHPDGDVRITSAVFPVLNVNSWCPG